MHPVARVSINKYRNLRTQQMLVQTANKEYSINTYEKLKESY
jgi:hypothetical protein